MSSADSMLARSSMLTPSAVVAAVFLSLLSSRLWLRYSRARRRYSLRTTSSGSMMRTPLMPSTMTVSFSVMSLRALCRPMTEGMSRLRPKMAVWLVGPPASVTNAVIFCSLNNTVSAGERSWAIRMVSSNRPSFRFKSLLWPTRLLWMRRTTCSMSCLRSRR